MPRPCSICNHPDREAIDRLLVAGLSNPSIVSKYADITESSLRRHKEGHIPTALAKSQQALDVAAADNLLAHAQKLEAKAWSLLIQAENSGDLKTAIQGVKAAKDCLEFHARISGELAPEKILLQLEPAISRIVLIIRQEVRDEDTLQIISQRLLQEPLSEGGIIDV